MKQISLTYNAYIPSKNSLDVELSRLHCIALPTYTLLSASQISTWPGSLEKANRSTRNIAAQQCYTVEQIASYSIASWAKHIFFHEFVCTPFKSLTRSWKLLEQKEKEKEAQIHGLHVATKVLLGQPVEKIIEYANKEKVDMIANGSICLSGISRLKALGSV